MLEKTVETQFGSLVVKEAAGAIVALTWGRAQSEAQNELLDEAARQLEAYDAGTLTSFDLPLHVRGNDLQRAVCAQMSAIPFGETVTYGDIAKTVGTSAQVVGRACGANPIAIIIPCHRVLGAKGLTGFSGGEGVETKVALLRHEKAGGYLL